MSEHAVLQAAMDRLQARIDAVGEGGGNEPLFTGMPLTSQEGHAFAQQCAQNALTNLADHHDVMKAIGAAVEYGVLIGMYAAGADA